MTLFDLYRKIKDIGNCLNSADVPLKCNDNDFNIDFEIESKDAIVSHIEVKQDFILNWKDVAILITIYEQEVEAGNISRCEDEDALSIQEASEIILHKFNELIEKRKR